MFRRRLILNDKLLARLGRIGKRQSSFCIRMLHLMLSIALSVDLQIGIRRKAGDGGNGILGDASKEMPPRIVGFRADDRHAGERFQGYVIVGGGLYGNRPAEGIADGESLALRAFVAPLMRRFRADHQRQAQQAYRQQEYESLHHPMLHDQ